MAVIVLHFVAAAFDECSALAYCFIEMRVEGFCNANYGNSECFSVCSVYAMCSVALKPFASRCAGCWFVARMIYSVATYKYN